MLQRNKVQLLNTLADPKKMKMRPLRDTTVLFFGRPPGHHPIHNDEHFGHFPNGNYDHCLIIPISSQSHSNYSVIKVSHPDLSAKMDDWDYYNDEILDEPNQFGRIYQAIGDLQRSNHSNAVHSSFLHIRLDLIEGDCLQSQFLFRTLHCEVSVNDQSQTTRFSIVNAENTQFRTRRDDRVDLVWELFEYYGPTPIHFKIVEHGLFSSVVRASGVVALGTLQSEERKFFNRTELSPTSTIVAEQTDQLSSQQWGAGYTVNLAKSSFIHPLSFVKYTHFPGNASSCEIANPDNGNKHGCVASGVVPFVGINDTESLGSVNIKFRYRIINILDCCRFYPMLSCHDSNKSSSEFHYAVEHHAVKLVMKLMRTLAQHSQLRHCLSMKNKKDHNALAIALLAKDVDMVRLLLSRAGVWCFQDTHPVSNLILPSYIVYCISNIEYNEQ